MRRPLFRQGFRAVAAIVALFIASPGPVAAAARPPAAFPMELLLNGVPVFAGLITATTVKDNSTTAVPFTLVAGTVLKIRCDVAAYIYIPTAATAANGDPVQANDPYYVVLRGIEVTGGVGDTAVSVLPVSAATANCKVWRMF